MLGCKDTVLNKTCKLSRPPWEISGQVGQEEGTTVHSHTGEVAEESGRAFQKKVTCKLRSENEIGINLLKKKRREQYHWIRRTWPVKGTESSIETPLASHHSILLLLFCQFYAEISQQASLSLLCQGHFLPLPLSTKQIGISQASV